MPIKLEHFLADTEAAADLTDIQLESLAEYLNSRPEPDLAGLLSFDKSLFRLTSVRNVFTRYVAGDSLPSSEPSAIVEQGVGNTAFELDEESMRKAIIARRTKELDAKPKRGRQAAYQQSAFVTPEELLDEALSIDALKELARGRYKVFGEAFTRKLKNHPNYVIERTCSVDDNTHLGLFVSSSEPEQHPCYIYCKMRSKSTTGKPREFASLTEARRQMEPINYKRKDGSDFSPLETYEEKVREILELDVDDRGKAVNLNTIEVPLRLGFVLAYFVYTPTRRKRHTKYRDARNVLNLCGNVDLTSFNTKKEAASTLLTLLASKIRKGGSEHVNRTNSSFNQLYSTLTSAFRLAHRDLRVDTFLLEGQIEEAIRDEEKAPTLQPDGRYPNLPRSDLKAILEAASQYSFRLLNHIFLQLSTTLRNDELDRLDGAFLNNGGNLIFSRPIERDGQQVYLTTKTMMTVPRELLDNAPTSILTKYILRYEQHESPDRSFFRKGGPLRKLLDVDRAHQRALRTAACTWHMLGYFGSHQASKHGIETAPMALPPAQLIKRTGHVDTEQLFKRYAKTAPPDYDHLSSLHYFNLEDFWNESWRYQLADDSETNTSVPTITPIRVKGVNVWEQETVFDLYLLHIYIDFLRRFRTREQVDTALSRIAGIARKNEIVSETPVPSYD